MRHRHRHHVSRVDDFKFLFLLFAVALWCCSILRGQRVAEPCERAGTCWIDHDGYLHWTAKEPRPGCPDASDARACERYRQSLAWQGEAQSYPATSQGILDNSAKSQTVAVGDPAYPTVWFSIDKYGYIRIDGMRVGRLSQSTADLWDQPPQKPLTRWQRFKAWWRGQCEYPWCWGVERD